MRPNLRPLRTDHGTFASLLCRAMYTCNGAEMDKGLKLFNCELATVWKFKNFTALQKLREINFSEFKVLKTGVLTKVFIFSG